MVYCALLAGPAEASLVGVGQLERLMIEFQMLHPPLAELVQYLPRQMPKPLVSMVIVWSKMEREPR